MSSLGQLALILVAAMLGPVLAVLSRGVVPIIVGELLAGVVLGRTGLQAVDPGRADLALLYSLGFATLMFTVGMHVPLHDVRLRRSLGRGVLAVLVTVPLAVVAGAAAHLVGGGPARIYALIIASSSAAVALPIISETKLEGPPILAAMAWITAADILATVAIPIVITPTDPFRAVRGVALVAVLIGVVFAFARMLGGRSEVQEIRHMGKKRGWAIDLRVALIVLVTTSFVAEKVGASLLVAGFGTGLVVGWLGGPKRLSHEVLGIGQGLLVPVFFVLLGAKLDLRALFTSKNAVLLAIVLAAVTVAVHVAASLLIRAPAAVGLLASAQVGVPAAVIAVGLPLRAITQAQASAIFCCALLSIAVCAGGAAILRRRREEPAAPVSAQPAAPPL
jgi:Kef-type K+ transport system membrane component KefB